MKSVKIYLADGFETIEALAVCDVLRRAGVLVSLVSVTGNKKVSSSHGVVVEADELLEAACNCGEFVMVFPGGMPGTKGLAQNKELMDLMKAHYAAGGDVAAICAAPGLVLSQLGPQALKGRELTCFDGFESYIIAQGGVFVKKPSVISMPIPPSAEGMTSYSKGDVDNAIEIEGRAIITGRSAGYAIDFALEIVKFLLGDQKASAVREAMLLPCE